MTLLNIVATNLHVCINYLNGIVLIEGLLGPFIYLFHKITFVSLVRYFILFIISLLPICYF